MQTSVRFPRTALSKRGGKGWLCGRHQVPCYQDWCTPSCTASALPLRLKIPTHHRQHSVEHHLSVKFRKTNQSCAGGAGVLSRLLALLREMTAYRYPLELKRDHTIAASASHTDRNLFKLWLMGEESKMRRKT